MEELRKVPHRLDRVIGRRPRLGQRMRGCAGHLAAALDRALVELDGHQRLADLVVEITPDRPPLVFLRVHELRREPLEIALVLTFLPVLLANPRLQTPGMPSREERDRQT